MQKEYFKLEILGQSKYLLCKSRFSRSTSTESRSSVRRDGAFVEMSYVSRQYVCECALTSGQCKVSRTGIDGCPLPVERPANCPPTSLSSALLPKLFSEESIDTDTHVPLVSCSFSFSTFDFLHQATYVSFEYCTRSFYHANSSLNIIHLWKNNIELLH